MKRRNLLKTGLFSSATLLALPSLARTQPKCIPSNRTPPQIEGPFYPVVDQLDKDADLVTVSGANKSAQGEVVIVEGVLTDQSCQVVAGALVEIWQACHTGRYNHPADPNTAELDPDFQYWGKAVTDKDGKYTFRTIIPGAYPADTDWIRPPHIHFKVAKLGYVELITQMYFSGQTLNTQDKILQNLKSADQKKVIVEFKKDSANPHPKGVFNIQIVKI